jgi:WD40-like Beta Propeller Repeat
MILRDALTTVADEVPRYEVVEAAIAAARRDRRRTAIGSILAAASVLALLLFALVPLAAPARPVPAGQLPPGVPDRIGPAGIFPTDVTDAPLGPAAVVFTEHRGLLQGGRLVLVGAGDDTYRIVNDNQGEAGRTALLSPDGTRIATTGTANAITVVDLRTGTHQSITIPVTDVDEAAPTAWLPDGSGLIVRTTTYSHDPTTQGPLTRLGVLGLDGRYQEFASATWPLGPDGWAVAVSPDGQRIAYQYSDFITVFDRRTLAKHSFSLAERFYSALAGRAAWSPDGRSLAIVQIVFDDLAAKRWRIGLLDPQSGALQDGIPSWSLAGMTIIRLTAWHDGNPVVVGYDADASPTGTLSYSRTIMPMETVRRVGLYELLPGTAARTLVQASGLTSLDVADQVAANGAVRPGHPPQIVTPARAVALTAVAVLLIGGGALRYLRRRRVHPPR